MVKGYILIDERYDHNKWVKYTLVAFFLYIYVC